MNAKFSLTNNTKIWRGITLFQIKAEASFGAITKGELGGYIEKEANLSVSGNAWVYGDAMVYGNAWVYGDARICAKASFTNGWFIGGDDSGKITEITDKTGSNYWKKQYVLGDYEITPIDEPKEKSLVGQEVSVTVGDKTYRAKIVE